jgi:hypothetical protein
MKQSRMRMEDSLPRCLSRGMPKISRSNNKNKRMSKKFRDRLRKTNEKKKRKSKEK